ncbi:glutamic acid-rich protein-like [Gigantopelta aegis]|uniref:glutamic acid-rich protein-like n=1 Tax=Gigantopelta aegis TaxID=1735272 RepID=UPI001B88B256|nr:glutamic acid-rich protein-like [Gigantopelta aegis]
MNTYSVLIFALYILVTQWQKINSEDRGKKNSSVKIDRRFNQSADEIFDRNNSLTRFKKDAIMHRSNKAARSLTEPLEYNKSNMQISSKHRLQKRFSNPYLSLGQILNAIQDFHNKRKHLTLQNTITEEELVLEPPPGPALVPDEESEIESEPVRESAPQPTEETIPESNEEPASQTIPEDEPVQEEEEDDEEEDEDEDEEEEYEEEEDEEDPTQGEEEEALQEEEDKKK